LTPLKRKAYSLQTELDRRRLNRQVRSLRHAGFPTKKRFEDLVVDSLPKDGQEAIPALKDLNFIKERRNVILIWNSGTGKTHMAIAVGIRACEENWISGTRLRPFAFLYFGVFMTIHLVAIF
jgi:DNA replication protein DnaC